MIARPFATFGAAAVLLHVQWAVSSPAMAQKAKCYICVQRSPSGLCVQQREIPCSDIVIIGGIAKWKHDKRKQVYTSSPLRTK